MVVLGWLKLEQGRRDSNPRQLVFPFFLPHGFDHVKHFVGASYSYLETDEPVVLIVQEFDVLEGELVKGLVRYPHRGQWVGLALQLALEALDVVQVDMGVAKGVDKKPRGLAALLGHQGHEERVAGDIEGYAEKYIG